MLEGAVPDEDGLADGIKAGDGALPPAQPWLAVDRSLRPWPASRRPQMAALRTIVATAVGRSAGPPCDPPPARPIRRLTLQPAATIIGNMAVRKRQVEDGLELAWDAAAKVDEWKVRVQQPTRSAP